MTKKNLGLHQKFETISQRRAFLLKETLKIKDEAGPRNKPGDPPVRMSMFSPAIHNHR